MSRNCLLLLGLLCGMFVGTIHAQSSYDSFHVHVINTNQDWILYDVQQTDKYTILVIDIYALDNKESGFIFRRSSYITVKGLSGYLHPVKWESGGKEYPLDQRIKFRKNSKNNYIRNKLYFPRIPAGYNYISFLMPNIISWENIYTNNANDARYTAITEKQLYEQWNKKSASGIEGIYQCTKVGGEITMSKDMRVGILYNESKSIYDVIVLNDHDFWSSGEVIAELETTTEDGIYKSKYWRNRNKVKSNSPPLAAFNANGMAVANENALAEFVRIYPIGNYNPTGSNTWSGTGWAIGNGYLITNNHVADGARTITVKGVGGDLKTGYKAELIVADKTNDLAILKITDFQFDGFGTLPYNVTTRIADVGEEVFVLGFPLTPYLGDEIKLTNGIISSRTGFQGETATYQMSAPIQPGNSGGPMFDNKGNVIGIVVSGVPGAENVGYAIKTSYLKILIESSDLDINLTNNNTISSLTLAEKVKRIKNFVFYIECSR